MLPVVAVMEQLVVQVVMEAAVVVDQKVAVRVAQERQTQVAVAAAVVGLVVAAQAVQALWSFATPVHSAVQAVL
jgi:hypothetical protein